MSSRAAKQRWQQQSTKKAAPKSRGKQLFVGITFVVVAVVATMIIIYAFLPSRVPRTFVRCQFVDDYGAFDIQSSHVVGDIRRLENLLGAGSDENRQSPLFAKKKILSGPALSIADDLDECGSDDIAIFYFAAQGICNENGDPCLMTSEDRRRELKPLVDQIAKLDAATKLILLDAGQVDSDFKRGIAVNAFVYALHQLMSDIDDTNLWLISSHGLFQISHISDANNGSVFASAVCRALESFRSDNGSPDRISIKSFYQSVFGRCVAYTESAGPYRQTPLLMRGQKGIVFAGDAKDFDRDLQDTLLHVNQIQLTTADAGDESPPAENPEEPADQVAETKSTAEPGKAGDAAEPAPASSEATALSPLELLWKTRDELQGRAYEYSPIDFAPHLWTGINDQLILFDRQQRQAVPPDEAKINETQRILQLLKDLIQSGKPASTNRARPGIEERWLDAWNQFIGQPAEKDERSAAARILANTQLFRDMLFRARYYVRWFDQASLIGVLDNKDELESLLGQLSKYKDKFSKTEFRGNPAEASDLNDIINALAELEWQIHGEWRFQVEKTSSAAAAEYSFADEYFLMCLLDSPLVGMDPLFGYGDRYRQQYLPKNQAVDDEQWLLSRNRLGQIYQQVTQNRAARLDNVAGDWAARMWAGDKRLYTNIQDARIKIQRDYMQLAQSEIERPALGDLPDDMGDPTAQTKLADYFKTYAAFGAKVKSELDRLASNPQRGLSFVIHERDLRSFLKQVDRSFVVAPLQFEQPNMDIHVKDFERNPGSNIIDLDRPATTIRKFAFRLDGVDPSGQALQVVADMVPGETKDAAAFARALVIKNGNQRVELGKPFPVDLASKSFNLSFDSAPEIGDLYGEKIRIRVRLDQSQVEHVIVDSNSPEIEFLVQMPNPDAVTLQVKSDEEPVFARSSNPQQNAFLQIKPFANRNRSYEFTLENNSGRTKSIQLQIFPVKLPSSLSPQPLPGRLVVADGQIDAQVVAANRPAKQVSPIAVNAEEIQLVPGARQVVKLGLPQPETPPATGGETGETGGATPAAPANGGEKDEGGAIPAHHGLLCRLVEKEIDYDRPAQTRDFWIELVAFDTADLLKQSATFELDKQRFTVTLDLATQALSVPGGLSCRIRSSQPDVQLVQPEDNINNTDRQAKFVAYIPRESMSDGRRTLLNIDVNDEPGVFIYELNDVDLKFGVGDEANIRNQPILELVNIAVVYEDPQKPEERRPSSNYLALLPPQKIDFDIWSNFDANSNIRVEFGASNMIPINQRQDRNISFESKLNEELGLLDVSALVSAHDFSFTEKGTGHWNMKAQVLTGTEPKFTTEQAFRFDSQPPEPLAIHFERERKNLTVKENENFDVEISAKDLSGVKLIELFVDANRNYRIDAEELAFLVASKTLTETSDHEEGESWVINVNTAELAGKILKLNDENFLLARLTDRLGLATDDNDPLGPVVVTVEKIIPPDEKSGAMGKSDERPKVKVVVKTFWKNALKNEPFEPAVIKFNGHNFVPSEQTGNEFVFNVPAGDYVISAQGQIEGRRSFKIMGHVEVKVGENPTHEFQLLLSKDGKLKPEKDDPSAPKK